MRSIFFLPGMPEPSRKPRIPQHYHRKQCTVSEKLASSVTKCDGRQNTCHQPWAWPRSPLADERRAARIAVLVGGCRVIGVGGVVS